MNNNSHQNILGVLGGIGPMASVEFVKTIYECSAGELEQELPAVVLYSDPSFPDRSQIFLRGEDDILLPRLIDALYRLCDMGADRIVMCCVTIHYLLPKLPDDLKEKVISLLDVLFALVEASEEKRLVVCSIGTQKLKIMQSHPRWSAAKDRLVFPSMDDQETIQQLIYGIKRNRGMSDIIAYLESLLKLHDVDSFLVACSEIHMVAKQFPGVDERRGKYSCLDPLGVIARDCAEGRLWAAQSYEVSLARQ